MAWDVMSGVAKMAWDVMSGVTKTAWDVLSEVANLCGMFCLECKKMAWDVLSGSLKSRMGSKFGRIRPGTYELAALEHLEKSLRLIMGEILQPL